ncbi:MAG: Uma2 family endonuclease [Polyangiaceae bacterium]
MSVSAPPELGLPAVDDHMIADGARFEVIDGRVIPVPPANEPHGTRHSELCALLEAHVADGYDVACDMLTRTAELTEVAPDASVFPVARTKTGGRLLEEIAIEILATERLSHAADKARTLSARGVRLVLAIDVEKKRALTWSVATDAWEMLPVAGVIEDRALAVPLPIPALTGAARADDAIARALLGKRHPVIEDALTARERKGKFEGKAEGKLEGKVEGKLEGKLETLLVLLRARGLAPSAAFADKLAQLSEPELDALVPRVLVCASCDELVP